MSHWSASVDIELPRSHMLSGGISLLEHSSKGLKSSSFFNSKKVIEAICSQLWLFTCCNLIFRQIQNWKLKRVVKAPVTSVKVGYLLGRLCVNNPTISLSLSLFGLQIGDTIH